MRDFQIDKFAKQIKHFCKEISKNEYFKLMRLDKPIGFLLALFPALWALVFAAKSLGTVLFYLPILLFGAVFIRGAGCIINDIIDRDLDKHVERTANRPIASGKISIIDAIKFLIILLALSLGMLLLLPKLAIISGFLTVIPILLYPFAKRYTHFPQIFLGLTFNLGVFIGWFAIQTQISLFPLILYIAACCWTVGYDSIYALQDRHDDEKVGIKSLALKYGDRTPEIVWTFYKATGLILGVAGIISHMNFLFYIIWGVAFYHLYWQIQTLDLNNKKSCAEKFESNVLFGALVLLACIIGKI